MISLVGPHAIWPQNVEPAMPHLSMVETEGQLVEAMDLAIRSRRAQRPLFHAGELASRLMSHPTRQQMANSFLNTTNLEVSEKC